MSSDTPIIIRHVKWRRSYGDPEFYPAADTDQFRSLVGTNRGTLIFIPADKSDQSERDEFSDRTVPEVVLRSIRKLDKLIRQQLDDPST